MLLATLILVTALELISGLGLLTGTLTRLSALISLGLSAALMPIFGWQGSTCIDEWTMSASNFAMGAVIFTAGGGAWSVDHWLMRRYPSLANRPWFRWFGSAPWPRRTLERWAKFLGIASLLWAMAFYGYYRGAILTPYHSGPVSPAKHHIQLSHAALGSDGRLGIDAYVNGGTPAVASHVIDVAVLAGQGAVVEHWNGEQLSALSRNAIHNVYDYNKFETGIYGLAGQVGAQARIELPPAQPGLHLPAGRYQVLLQTIGGNKFRTTATVPGADL
ncbi:MAG: TQO small subunit DoxD [Pseudomonadota bacterium]